MASMHIFISDGTCKLKSDCSIPPDEGCPKNQHWVVCSNDGCREERCGNPRTCSQCRIGVCCGEQNKCICNEGFVRYSGSQLRIP